jgi:ferredoxin
VTVEEPNRRGRPDAGGGGEDEQLRVRVDQDLCTGDGLCVQYAPEVFEFDIDGVAYVKDLDGQLRQAPGSQVDVPQHLRLEVIDAARDCPGHCIFVEPGGPTTGRPTTVTGGVGASTPK